MKIIMKTVINIKTDKAIKDEAKKLAQEFGLPLSTLLNSYLKQFIRTREIYLSTAPRMTPGLEQIIAEAEEDLRKDRNVSPVLSSPEEMNSYLDSL